MHTRPGSEVLNQDRREFLTTTATGIAAAGMASLFPACPAPAEQMTQSVPSASETVQNLGVLTPHDEMVGGPAARRRHDHVREFRSSPQFGP